MPIRKLIAAPTPSNVALSGRYFQLLSGAECTVRFFGLNAEFDTEETVRVGDLLEFPERFARFEITSEYATPVEVYTGQAKLTRSRQDFTLTGASSIKSSSKAIPKAEALLVSDNANRRSVTIIPINADIMIGSVGTSPNDKIPVAVGMPVTLDITAALYAETVQTAATETADVRILEEVN